MLFPKPILMYMNLQKKDSINNQEKYNKLAEEVRKFIFLINNFYLKIYCNN